MTATEEPPQGGEATWLTGKRALAVPSPARPPSPLSFFVLQPPAHSLTTSYVYLLVLLMKWRGVHGVEAELYEIGKGVLDCLTTLATMKMKWVWDSCACIHAKGGRGLSSEAHRKAL
ncbi:unnamed protein product [Discosporangium mesarthrocarpum]